MNLPPLEHARTMRAMAERYAEQGARWGPGQHLVGQQIGDAMRDAFEAGALTAWQHANPDRTRPEGEQRMYPGDPRYDGFRLRELWAVVATDPQDDQEGIVVGAGGPLVAADSRRLDDYVLPIARRMLPHGALTLKHFTIDHEEPIQP